MRQRHCARLIAELRSLSCLGISLWRRSAVLLGGFAAVSVATPMVAQVSASMPNESYQISFMQGFNWGPVQFELINNNIIFQAMVNGRPATVLLDNGTGKTLVDRDFARRAGIGSRIAAGSALVGHSALPTWRTDVVNLELPRALTIRGSLLALDLTPMTKASHRPIDIVLGGDILDAMAVMIRPDSREFSLAPSGAITVKGPDTVTFPLVAGNKVDAVIQGQRLRLQIDLGFSGAVRLTDAAWDRVFADAHMSHPETFMKADGLVATARTATAYLNIGTVAARDTPVSDSYVSAGSDDGLLGSGFLLQGTVVLDVPNRRMTMILSHDKTLK